MEVVYKNTKEHIDNLILSVGPKIKEIIVTHDEYNDFMGAVDCCEMATIKSIGYRRVIYCGIIIQALER